MPEKEIDPGLPVEQQPVPISRPALKAPNIRRGQLVLSILLGALIWVYVDSRQSVEVTFESRLELRVPEGWEVEGNVPAGVTVRVRGSRQVMASLKQDEVSLVKTIPRPETPGDSRQRLSLALDSEDLRGLPPEVNVTIVEPLRLDAWIVRLITRKLTVEVQTSGTPAEGYMVALTQAEPWYVEVKAPEGFLVEGDAIKTERISIEGRSAGFSNWVNLVPFTREGRALHVDKQVYATVEIIEAPVTNMLEEKTPVRLLVSPDEQDIVVELNPAAVQVTVEGFIDNVTKLKASDIQVYVDSRDKVPAGKGHYVVTCKALPLDRARVVKIDPPQVQWVVHSRKDSAVKGASPPDRKKSPAPVEKEQSAEPRESIEKAKSGTSGAKEKP